LHFIFTKVAKRLLSYSLKGYNPAEEVNVVIT
jgi:hypothetical protein